MHLSAGGRKAEVSSDGGQGTTAPPRDPTWGSAQQHPTPGPAPAPRGGRDEPGGSPPSQPPGVPHPSLPTTPLSPQPLTCPRQDEDLLVRQALLLGELGEPLQALGSELLRPTCSRERGERQPPRTPHLEGSRCPGVQGTGSPGRGSQPSHLRLGRRRCPSPGGELPHPGHPRGVLGGVPGQTYCRAAPWWRSRCSWRCGWPPRRTHRSWSPPRGCRACCPSLGGRGGHSSAPHTQPAPRDRGWQGWVGSGVHVQGCPAGGRAGSRALTGAGVAESPRLLRLGVKAVPLLALVTPGERRSRASAGPGAMLQPTHSPRHGTVGGIPRSPTPCPYLG